MATTLTAPASTSDDLVYASFPISKFEKVDPNDPNSDIYVYGKATDGSVDSDEQIVDSDFSSKAIADWLSSGANVRVQHNSQRDPAGIGVEATSDNDGATWVKSLVVEPTAKILVSKGALRAYSVGIARPKIVRDSVARGGRIVDGEIVEISLVDRPANKNCGIQLVKAATIGGAPVWVGETWDNRDDGEMVNVDIPRNASISFSPADLAKLMTVKKNLEADVEKRKFDPGVGGGTDRDKIPAADFAGPDRSFPIVTPKDVTDAAGLAGHADNPDAVRARIRSIAHRKGPEFVAALPASWSDDAKKSSDVPDDTDDLEDTNDEKLVNSATKAADDTDNTDENDNDDATDKAADDGDGDGETDEAKPDTTKGAKKCGNCGKNFHADSKLKRCSGCNAKLPKANKAAKPVIVNLENQRIVSDADLASLVEKMVASFSRAGAAPRNGVQMTPEPVVEKKSKVMCKGCGANVHDKHSFCPECGKSLNTANPIDKGHDFTCLGCGSDLDKDDKFCPDCGKKNPSHSSKASANVEAGKAQEEGAVDKTDEPKTKKGKPTPDVSGGGPAAAAIEPVPAHREPDGQYVEDFEHDANLPTDPDASYELKAAHRVKAAGAPYQLGALHDLTCPGFHPAHAAKAHPSVRVEELELGYWRDLVEQSVYSGTFAEARKSAVLLQAAEALKALGSGGYFGAALDAHKAMQSANPGRGAFPSPTVITPGQFQRPVITSDHAKPGMDYDAPNAPGKVPAAGGIHADDFNRGPLTAGQAAQSPGNKSATIILAMLHDHLAEAYPALCPLGAVPAEAAKADEPTEVVEKGKKNKKGDKQMPPPAQADDDQDDDTGGDDDQDQGQDAGKNVTQPGVTKAATIDADLIKSAMLEVTGGLLEKLEEVHKALKAEQKKNKKLAEQVDVMADMADPRVFAYRSAAAAGPLTKNANPAGWHPLAETAERTQAALLSVLHDNARNSADASVRESAWDEIYRMTGIGGQ